MNALSLSFLGACHYCGIATTKKIESQKKTQFTTLMIHTFVFGTSHW
jgi:hypothetical protein